MFLRKLLGISAGRGWGRACRQKKHAHCDELARVELRANRGALFMAGRIEVVLLVQETEVSQGSCDF